MKTTFRVLKLVVILSSTFAATTVFGQVITWTDAFKIQPQTNSLNVGISNNWSDYPGGGTSPVTVPIGVTNETVFFRLAPTP